MKKLQQGFSLVTAIFLVVVIAALGTFAVTLSTTQQQDTALDVMGARAYQAAHAGIEWAAYQVGISPLNAATAAPCATTLSSLGGDLAPFTVTVTCTSIAHIEGASTVWIYDVSSSAQTGGNPNVQRIISVKLVK